MSLSWLSSPRLDVQPVHFVMSGDCGLRAWDRQRHRGTVTRAMSWRFVCASERGPCRTLSALAVGPAWTELARERHLGADRREVERCRGAADEQDAHRSSCAHRTRPPGPLGHVASGSLLRSRPETEEFPDRPQQARGRARHPRKRPESSPSFNVQTWSCRPRVLGRSTVNGRERPNEKKRRGARIAITPVRIRPR